MLIVMGESKAYNTKYSLKSLLTHVGLLFLYLVAHVSLKLLIEHVSLKLLATHVSLR